MSVSQHMKTKLLGDPAYMYLMVRKSSTMERMLADDIFADLLDLSPDIFSRMCHKGIKLKLGDSHDEIFAIGCTNFVRS
jgi:hypothetical protein